MLSRRDTTAACEIHLGEAARVCHLVAGHRRQKLFEVVVRSQCRKLNIPVTVIDWARVVPRVCRQASEEAMVLAAESNPGLFSVVTVQWATMQL